MRLCGGTRDADAGLSIVGGARLVTGTSYVWTMSLIIMGTGICTRGRDGVPFLDLGVGTVESCAEQTTFEGLREALYVEIYEYVAGLFSSRDGELADAAVGDRTATDRTALDVADQRG